MLAGAAAAEVFPADYDWIFRVELAFLDEADRIKRVRQPAKSVATELLVFVRNRRHESQVLRRNDLVGVYVVANNVNRTCKHRLHDVNLASGEKLFNQNVMEHRDAANAGRQWTRSLPSSLLPDFDGRVQIVFDLVNHRSFVVFGENFGLGGFSHFATQVGLRV